jgi:hypothetical protein
MLEGLPVGKRGKFHPYNGPAAILLTEAADADAGVAMPCPVKHN